MTEKQRTSQQRKALQVWCRELARESQAQGLSARVIMEKIQIDWTEDMVKAMVRNIGEAMTGKKSTADLTTIELTNACREVDKIFLERGINISFPNLEEQEFINHYSK